MLLVRLFLILGLSHCCVNYMYVCVYSKSNCFFVQIPRTRFHVTCYLSVISPHSRPLSVTCRGLGTVK